MPRDIGYEAMKKACDELLGLNRNGDGDDPSKKKLSDPDLCPYFMAGMCPHELFSNTRADLGPCSKKHFDVLRDRYNKVKETENYGFEKQLKDFLQDIVTKCDRENELKRKRRVDEGEDPAELAKESQLTSELTQLSEQMRAKTAEAEKASEEGDLDASEALTAEVEELKTKRANVQKEMQEMQESKRSTKHEAKLRMCELCGAFLSIYDNDSRLADHFLGKLHVGFSACREKLDELKDSLRSDHRKGMVDGVAKSFQDESERGQYHGDGRGGGSGANDFRRGGDSGGYHGDRSRGGGSDRWNLPPPPPSSDRRVDFNGDNRDGRDRGGYRRDRDGGYRGGDRDGGYRGGGGGYRGGDRDGGYRGGGGYDRDRDRRGGDRDRGYDRYRPRPRSRSPRRR